MARDSEQSHTKLKHDPLRTIEELERIKLLTIKILLHDR